MMYPLCFQMLIIAVAFVIWHRICTGRQEIVYLGVLTGGRCNLQSPTSTERDCLILKVQRTHC